MTLFSLQTTRSRGGGKCGEKRAGVLVSAGRWHRWASPAGMRSEALQTNERTNVECLLMELRERMIGANDSQCVPNDAVKPARVHINTLHDFLR